MSRERRDRSEIARRALERATATPEPALDALAGRMPQVLAEAARRRSRQSPEGAIAAAALLARAAMPRLALVSALLAGVALATVLLDRRTGDATDADAVLFVENGLTDDAIVESILTLENGP